MAEVDGTTAKLGRRPADLADEARTSQRRREKTTRVLKRAAEEEHTNRASVPERRL